MPAESSQGLYDLHAHTTASDGAWSPGDVVRGAAAGGLDVIAITDHDTMAGVAPAMDAAMVDFVDRYTLRLHNPAQRLDSLHLAIRASGVLGMKYAFGATVDPRFRR